MLHAMMACLPSRPELCSVGTLSRMTHTVHNISLFYGLPGLLTHAMQQQECDPEREWLGRILLNGAHHNVVIRARLGAAQATIMNQIARRVCAVCQHDAQVPHSKAQKGEGRQAGGACKRAVAGFRMFDCSTACAAEQLLHKLSAAALVCCMHYTYTATRRGPY
jgi:hypothetical protein